MDNDDFVLLENTKDFGCDNLILLDCGMDEESEKTWPKAEPCWVTAQVCISCKYFAEGCCEKYNVNFARDTDVNPLYEVCGSWQYKV